LEGRNYKEANILMNAILTILKINKEERRILDEAREKATFWNSAKSIITDNLGFSKEKPIDFSKI
jgi:hypothetical protein